MIPRLAALLLALIASPALAQEDDIPARYGVWQGTIGSYPVVACLGRDRYNQVGAYYYLSRLAPIALKGNQSDHWEEEVSYQESSASWDSLKVEDDRLSGKWNDGKRSLAIALVRQDWVPDETFGEPCTSAAFLGPRAGGDSVGESDGSIDGQSFRRRTYVPAAHFSSVGVASFQLLPTRPGDELINAELAKDLPDGTAGSDLMLCMGWAIEAHGTDGDYWFSSEPILMTRRWLATFDRFDQYCGGPHPNTWLDYRLFDRQTGEKVELFNWLNADAVTREAYDLDSGGVYFTVNDTLRKRILARWPADELPENPSEEDLQANSECMEIVATQEFWSVGLVQEGLLFAPQLARVVMACGATVTVPWADLEPYLSDEGRAGLAALRADEAP